MIFPSLHATWRIAGGLSAPAELEYVLLRFRAGVDGVPLAVALPFPFAFGFALFALEEEEAPAAFAGVASAFFCAEGDVEVEAEGETRGSASFGDAAACCC